MNKSREIKFRAWDKETNVMLTPDFIVNGGGEVGDYPRGYWDDGPDFYEDIVLMQYTGLKDKSGKEIYEGDILSVPGGWSGDFRAKPKIAEVVWAGEECGGDGPGFWVSMPECVGYKDCEVIGNIYENPELLEKP